MKNFFMLFLLLGITFSCSSVVSQFVPAVVGNGGSLVNMTIQTEDGSGETYIAISPRTGVSTQDSIEQAVNYAKILANKNCDVFIKFDEKSASFIEGPSAGTAITVMTYAALTGSDVRDDAVITGAIDRTGNVGPVGGLYEKAKSAEISGARYFITPVENFYEMLLLNNLDIQILEAKTVRQVIDFMIYNKTIEQVGIQSRMREIPEFGSYDDSEFAEFREIANNMITLESGLVGSINDSTIREFFDNELSRQKRIEELGYTFSSANEAFLNYIELKTIIGIENGDVDLEKEKDRIRNCIDSLPRPGLTVENYEYVVGSDLRKQWAYDRLDEEYETDILKEEKFFLYNDLVYADAWCNVASELLDHASDGSGIDESTWKELAGEKIDEARSLELDGALEDRLDIAEDSYAKGLYGAAIVDSVYVIESKNAEMVPPYVDDENEIILNTDMESMWGNVYRSHGAYLLEMNETEAAYRTLSYARGLDIALTEMKKVEEKESFDFTPIVVFLLIVLVIILGRVYAGNNRGYRNRKKEKRLRFQETDRDGSSGSSG